MKAPELRLYWSKAEKDFKIHYPCKPDGHFIWGAVRHCSLLDSKTFLEELEERGYDIKTLRISVRKKV